MLSKGGLNGIGLDVDHDMEQLIDPKYNKRIKMIPLLQIEMNPLNHEFDSEEEIKMFADEIYDQGGVRDPVHLYRKENSDKYVLLGGHKRTRACLLNLEIHKDAQTVIPAILESMPRDWVEETLMLEELNQNRHYDDEKLLIRAKGLYMVWMELIDRNEKPLGERRKWFAKKLGCGIKKAERFINIIEGKVEEKNTKLSNKPKYSPDKQYEDVRIHLQYKLKTKVSITNNSLNIKFCNVDDFNRLLELIGCDGIVNE